MGTMSNICVEIICNVTFLWLALYILYSEKKTGRNQTADDMAVYKHLSTILKSEIYLLHQMEVRT